MGFNRNDPKGFQLVRKYNLIALLEDERGMALIGNSWPCRYAIKFTILLTRSNRGSKMYKHEQYHYRNKHQARVARFDLEGSLASRGPVTPPIASTASHIGGLVGFSRIAEIKHQEVGR